MDLHTFYRIGTLQRRLLVSPLRVAGEEPGMRASRASPSPISRIRSRVLSIPELPPGGVMTSRYGSCIGSQGGSGELGIRVQKDRF